MSGSPGAFCTIATRSYLPQARVLAASFQEHHPGRRLGVLVVDDEQGQIGEADEAFRVLRPSDLEPVLERDELRRMALMYDAKELSTALKPFLLRRLLDEGAPTAIFLDPDIEVYAPLEELEELTATHSITLIPHSVSPIPLDGETPTEVNIQRAGIYNGGYLGVSQAARPFLAWLCERLRRDCVVAYEEGLFVDQRWLDFVPAYFEHVIVRDRAYDVAHWNLHERDVEWTGERYEVDGRPLRFFHFSAFDPERPEVLSRGGSRIRLAERPALRRLCREHAERLLASGYREWAGIGYGYGSADDGRPLTSPRRRLYRAAVKHAEKEGRELPAGGLPETSVAEAARFVLSEELERAAPAEARVEYYLREEIVLRSYRFGAVGVLARRILLGLLRPYRERQERIARAILEAVRERDERLRRDLLELGERLDFLGSGRG